MYVVLSISADETIAIHDIADTYSIGKESLRRIAYSNVGCVIENKTATKMLVYKNTPGYIYGKYKTLIKTIYLVPYNNKTGEQFTYADVVNELKEKLQLRSSL